MFSCDKEAGFIINVIQDMSPRDLLCRMILPIS